MWVGGWVGLGVGVGVRVCATYVDPLVCLLSFLFLISETGKNGACWLCSERIGRVLIYFIENQSSNVVTYALVACVQARHGAGWLCSELFGRVLIYFIENQSSNVVTHLLLPCVQARHVAGSALSALAEG